MTTTERMAAEAIKRVQQYINRSAAQHKYHLAKKPGTEKE